MQIPVIAATCVGLLSCAASDDRSTQSPEPPVVVPAPSSLIPGAGRFQLDTRTRIVLSDPADPELSRLADYLAGPLRAASGLPLPIDGSPARAMPSNSIRLSIDDDDDDVSASGPYDWSAGIPESYRLRVDRDGIELSAQAHAGLFRGLQTLRQLLPPAIEAGFRTSPARPDPPPESGRANPPPAAARPDWSVPAVMIEDAPRFRYRGMHLDVGRHTFPVEFIRKYIDLIAAYRMNVFHWHLTEDQGWRIEIRKYPRLTEVGAFRRETILERNFDPYIGDGTPYGGYFTRDQVRDIVEYAASRYVTIIPEIEMPGHSVAALAAYPELACTPGPFEVATVWGVKEDIYCPSERTFEFLQDVLTEVMELFPGRYIHIGGDEAPKAAWRRSDLAQDVIRREGLDGEDELQSWFVRRIERFLDANGRRIIGWDEILEGGLAPGATVMSWRGMDGGIEAARQGHDVVMTPTSHVYFDYYQGDPAGEPLAIGGLTTLDRVYSFEPVPEPLSADEARHVLGAQGNVWTEYIRTPSHVEYMALPRMIALAEVVWTPPARRDWPDFLRRLPAALERLDSLGVNYRAPDVTGLEEDRPTPDDTVRPNPSPAPRGGPG